MNENPNKEKSNNLEAVYMITLSGSSRIHVHLIHLSNTVKMGK